jgi:Flp pilus assembly secretin CpaC
LNRCFRAIISEPQELKVQSSINLKKELVSLNLSGADTYDIYINKKKIKFSDSKISLNLRKGLNVLKIKTDLECQGTYEKNIYLDSSSIIYPNPVDDNLIILVGGEKTKFEIFIFDLQGNLIKNKTIEKIEPSRKIRISTNELTTGSYILRIHHFDKTESIKFIKK